MCGIMTDYDTIQNKIKNGYVFKVINAKGLDFSDVCMLLTWRLHL